MGNMYLLSFYLLCTFNIFVSVKCNVITTTFGNVRGKLVDDVTTGAYFVSFQGIPYAEAPVGKLRFQPPVRKRPWRTTFDATRPGYVCPQVELVHSKMEMNEDCLNFNIYTPANYKKKLRPVVFNIHGGEFDLMSGKAEPIYGPELLILNDVVVVTMNYRLGALGFLSLCNKEISGNAGLKDIILVLKIVHENIERFGGDPNKITIMGMGAGACLGGSLMLTDQCTGYYQNVILNSGSFLSTKYLQLNPRENARLLCRELGIDTSNDEYMMTGLKQADVFDIIRAQVAIFERNPQRGYSIYTPFTLTVETKCESAVLTKSPLEMLREGTIRDVPMFIGFTDQEGVEILRILKDRPDFIERLNNNFELLIPADIKYPYGSSASKYLAARIKGFYLNSRNVSVGNFASYINLVSDSQYIYPIDSQVNLFTKKKKSPVYYYIFSADTELNWFKAYENITYPGAAHFDDIGYVFLTSIAKSRYKYLDPTSKHIQNSILLNIKNYMYYGAPAPNPNTNCWPEAGKDRFHIIQDYDSTAVFHRPLSERMDFWRSVYEEYFASIWYAGNNFCRKDIIVSVT